jgi:hypothetical protein
MFHSAGKGAIQPALRCHVQAANMPNKAAACERCLRTLRHSRQKMAKMQLNQNVKWKTQGRHSSPHDQQQHEQLSDAACCTAWQ